MNHNRANIETALLHRFYADGNPKWLGLILEHYTAFLLGVCMKYLKEEAAAKDAVQQVFLKALAEIPKKTILNLGAWLYQVAKNECLTQLRSARPFLNEDYLSQLVQPEEKSLSQWLFEEEKSRELINALARLKQEQKACIVLFFFEKKSYKQIAALQGYSVKQVKSNIQNGKRNLKMELAAFAPEKNKKERHDE